MVKRLTSRPFAFSMVHPGGTKDGGVSGLADADALCAREGNACCLAACFQGCSIPRIRSSQYDLRARAGQRGWKAIFDGNGMREGLHPEAPGRKARQIW